MTERARLVALPLVAALILAVAVGTAAHQSAQTGPTDRQASIEATTVVLTLLGMAIVGSAVYLVWIILTGDRQGGGGGGQRHPSLIRELVVCLIALSVVAGIWALVMLWPSHTQQLAAGGAGLAPVHAEKTKPLPYDAAVGGLTAGSTIAVVAAISAWVGIRRYSRRRGRRGDAFLTELPPTADAVSADVLAGLRAQLATLEVADPRAEPDPRKAVIAAWTTMTEVIAGRWRRREPSETPFEYLHEALTGAGVGSGSAGRLTSLFEEARWGGATVGEEMRTGAIAALDAVRAELAASDLAASGLPVAG